MSVLVSIRVSEGERDSWKGVAGSAGVSKWLRDLANRECRRGPYPVDRVSVVVPVRDPGLPSSGKKSYESDWVRRG
jgi:hypothetical protein